jgi:hypothetical protein
MLNLIDVIVEKRIDTVPVCADTNASVAKLEQFYVFINLDFSCIDLD